MIDPAIAAAPITEAAIIKVVPVLGFSTSLQE